MENNEVQQPIINSPYGEPKAHWKISAHEPAEKAAGRRPPAYMYLPPRKPAGEAGERVAVEEKLELVSLLRQRVAEWRPLALRGEGGVSRVTMELLNHWRSPGRKQPLFFAQLEAAETIIFLTEARRDFLHGIVIPPDQGAAFKRLCCRMATGAGKTTVMAMLAAWSILNKVDNKQDRRFSDAVLVVCPNVTIRDRLAELNPKRGEASIYFTRDIVPKGMRALLRKGRVLTPNWHVFEPRNMQAGNKVVRAGKHIVVQEKVIIGAETTTARGRRYMTEADLRQKQMLGLLEIRSEERNKDGSLKSVEIKADKYVESDAALMRRVLEKELGAAGNILVFNDEAHHAYRPQAAADNDEAAQDSMFEDDDMVQDYCNEATVWVKGLDTVQDMRGINFCVDFSATPYFLAKAGDETNRIFPWTVSSFDLQDAIESGLVKIPQLAVRDASGADIPGYFNIWKWILPKLTSAERGGKKSNAKPEAVLKYAYTPLMMLGGMWRQAFLERGEDGEDPRPPVFIIVCKTTKLADTVYQWLAEDQSPAGIPSAQLAELRNSAERRNTICVHSDMQRNLESGQIKGDEERWMRHTLDTIGKRDWPLDSQGRPQYPEGFEALAAKMGRPMHPPGRDVRCIVSVGMLTEGWDCNTVTHIIGLRPFMSQLLCEQVVGRGLRRFSYEIGENNLMREEIATVLGVPLTAFTVKSRIPPVPPVKRHHIHALPEKEKLAIHFPRVEGYYHSVRRRIVCDLGKLPPLNIDPAEIPPEVEMKAGLPDNKGRLSLHGPGRMSQTDLAAFRGQMRLRERIWEMAAALTKHYAGNPDCQLPGNAAFLQLHPIVEAYIFEKVSADHPADKKDAFTAPYYGFIIERLLEGIRPDESAGEAPELPRYERMRGKGSTGDVDFYTRREPYPARNSHINAVVPDTKKLEQQAARRIDRHAEVFSFAKNEGMGFGIPYFHNGELHEYMPDFLIRLKGGGNRCLILETKGYDKLKEIKRSAAERWVSAVNAEGSYGLWQYAMVADSGEIDGVIDAAARSGR